MCGNAWHATRWARHLQERLLAASGLLPDELGLTLEAIHARGEGSRQMIAAAHPGQASPGGSGCTCCTTA